MAVQETNPPGKRRWRRRLAIASVAICIIGFLGGQSPSSCPERQKRR